MYNKTPSLILNGGSYPVTPLSKYLHALSYRRNVFIFVDVSIPGFGTSSKKCLLSLSGAQRLTLNKICSFSLFNILLGVRCYSVQMWRDRILISPHILPKIFEYARGQSRYVVKIVKMGRPWPLVPIFLVFFKKTMQFLKQM